MTAYEKHLVSDIRNAVRPWQSAFSEPNSDLRKDRRQEPQREIDTCLECPLSECMDCYRYKKYRFSYLAKIKTSGVCK